MKPLALSAALLASSVLAAPASAQTTVPANQRYCLGVMDFEGPQPLLCRFTTMQQCIASKTWAGDYCMLNPHLAFQQRKRG